MLFSAIIYWNWEAMLISYLATRVIILPFDGVASLIDKSNFQIAVWPGTSLEDAFKLSTDPAFKKAWTGRIEPYLNYYQTYAGILTFQKNVLKHYFIIKGYSSAHGQHHLL